MKLQTIKEHVPTLEWDYTMPSDEVLESLDLDDPEAVVEAFNLMAVYRMPEVVSCNESAYNEAGEILNEMTYKEFATLIDGNFLSQNVRYKQLEGVFFLEAEGDKLLFNIPSSEYADNGIKYINVVQWDQWDEVGQDPDLTAPEKARLLLWAGDIKLFCSCPSYLYYGFSYLQSAMNSAVYDETRPPNIKNPKQRGICCKHQRLLLTTLPFHSGDIAKSIKEQFGGE